MAAHLGFDEESLAALQTSPRARAASGCVSRACGAWQSRTPGPIPGLASHLPAVRMAGFQALHCTPLITGSGNTIGALTVYFRQTRRPSPREIALVELCAQQATAFIENARLYAKLREEDRTKNEFLATLAHELRNPLAPIRNAVHVLQLVLHLNDATTDESRWALQVIERQMQQLSRLVDDLLDLARITSNKLELRNDRITLGEIVEAAVEASAPLIDGCQHELVICEPPQPLYIHGDLTRLAQVVVQPPQQRGQVHRAGRPHPADRRAARRRGRHRGAGQRHRHLRRRHAAPASSTCSLKPTAPSIRLRAGSASA